VSQLGRKAAELLGSGLSVEDAAAQIGVSGPTLKSWLSRGRKDPDSDYGRFLAQVEGLKERKQSSGPMTDDEFDHELARQIRKGSVPAMKVYLEWRRERNADESATQLPQDPLEFADELAARRAA
jgi:hypothetical protein